MVEAIRQGDIPGVQLRHRQRLPIGVDAAWEWLTSPTLLERWLCGRARVDLAAEGSLLLESPQEEAKPLVERGDTLEIEPPGSWSLAFRQLDRGWKAPTRLTLKLHLGPEGSELDIFHEGFEHLSLSTCLTVWEEYRRRWREASARLVAALDTP
jgi:hypothetical protein